MVTDAQVRLMRQARMDGKTQATAAAVSDMSLRTAREWETGPVPSGTKRPRDWRTRPDPFAAVWPTDVEPLLRSDRKGVLESEVGARGVADAVSRAVSPGASADPATPVSRLAGPAWCGARGLLRASGRPGREAAIDFTHATELGITIAGDPFPHLPFEFVLSYSHWTWVTIAFGETFEALAAGVQGALWALGGVPAVLRSDNLSAATHELKTSGGRALTPRFRAVLEHYGIQSSRIAPGGRMKTGSPSRRIDDSNRSSRRRCSCEAMRASRT
jgi:hypothetical protein